MHLNQYKNTQILQSGLKLILDLIVLNSQSLRK